MKRSGVQVTSCGYDQVCTKPRLIPPSSWSAIESYLQDCVFLDDQPRFEKRPMGLLCDYSYMIP